ncbi:MAG: VOC family protein [Variibacter sp.]
MSAQLECVDHPVFAVNDLSVASDVFRKLGFVVPPIGKHQEWGTGNICIMFARDYLEIRGIADRSRYLAGLEEFLADGEGLIGVAFGTPSADERYRTLREAGVAATEPRGLQRRLELSDGNAINPRFRNVMLQPGDHPGFFHANFCQHLTFDELRQPGWLDHPNTAVSAGKVVGVTDDLGKAQAKYETLFGKEVVSRSENAVWLRFPIGAPVELITPAEAKERHIDQPKRGTNYMASLEINVRSLDALQAVLKKNGVGFRLDGRAIVIDPDQACGAHLGFVEAEHGRE